VSHGQTQIETGNGRMAIGASRVGRAWRRNGSAPQPLPASSPPEACDSPSIHERCHCRLVARDRRCIARKKDRVADSLNVIAPNVQETGATCVASN
jgi:hypothetical protein